MTKHVILRVAATALCAALILPAQKADSAESLLQAATKKELVDGNLAAAIEGYRKAVAAAKGNRNVAAKALLRLGECYEKQGNAEARRAYERLVNEYSDQKDQAHDAQARLAALGAAVGGKGILAQQIEKRIDLDGRITQDGKLYVFTNWQTGDIAVRDLSTHSVRRLTNMPKSGTEAGYYGLYSRPSPDGRRVAYLWHTEKNELRVVNMDGSGMRTVPLKPLSWVEPMDWTSDGKSVLGSLVMDPGERQWAIIDVTTGGIQPVPMPRIYRQVAGFSPDGRWIVYAKPVGQGKPDRDILSINVATGEETAVVQGAGYNHDPWWVPGTNKIVFQSDRDGRDALWMVHFQNGRAAGSPVLIKPDTAEYWGLGISRDGSLFFGVSHWTQDIYEATVDPKTLKAQDTPKRLVETFRGRNSKPVWSPSGDAFAYYSRREAGDVRATQRLVIRHPDGKEIVVPEPIVPAFLPHWCQNGESLTVLGTPSFRQIQFINARTGEPSPAVVQVRTPQGASYQPALSSDCKSVYFSAHWGESKQRRIFRYDLVTGKESNILTDTGDWATGPTLSPDGRWLAVQGDLPGSEAQGVLLISTETGTARIVAPHPRIRSGTFSVSFTPDSKRVMYARQVNPDQWAVGDAHELYWVPVEGGDPQPMGIRMPGASAPSLNADEKRILFSTNETNTDLWVLRNLPLD